MLKILNWLKPHNKGSKYIKPQKFVEIKRNNTHIEFIHQGHPLYDNIVAKEENNLRLLAPNEAAYNETSLIHNFVAIATYKEDSYLVINSFKHFKEQSIGGLLQYDENIFEVIPFFEDDEEYQTANSHIFSEIYEYDHPVESYALTVTHNQTTTKLIIERGKQPLTLKMIDAHRQLFTEKLTPEQIEMVDYIIIPALDSYLAIQQKNKAS